MEKRRISAKELLGDIQAGLDDDTLMRRHGLTHETLQYSLNRLVEEGLVTSMQLYERTSLSESTITRAFSESHESVLRCQRCGRKILSQLGGCPYCETVDLGSTVELSIDAVPLPFDSPISEDSSAAIPDAIAEQNIGAMIDDLFNKEAESDSGDEPQKIKKDENYGNRALLKAASRGPVRLVERLLMKGIDVNVRGERGSTPLMRSCVKGHVDITRLLIKWGADVDAQNAVGNTALIAATIFGLSEIIELLIARGADVNVRNTEGITALKYAKQRGHKKVADLLTRFGAKE